MRNPLSLCAASLPLLSSILIAQPDVHPEELALKPKIDAAIARGVESLIATQHRDGSWGAYPGYPGGKTAMCAYALLKCGVSPDAPVIRRAMARLEALDPKRTYTVACMMLAYGATGLAKYEPKLQELLDKLLEWDRGGEFGYPYRGNGRGWSRPDLSNSQYAALGFWIARKHRLDVPLTVWVDLAKTTFDYRAKVERVKFKQPAKSGTSSRGGKRDVAGFRYERGHKPTGSMTAAGAAVLQIAKLGLGEKVKPGLRRKIDAAVDGAINWLASEFTVEKNPHKKNHHYYYLYGLERLGSLTRREQFGEHWWYLAGAKFLLAQQKDDGSWFEKGGHAGEGRRNIDTCFALLFLRRATSAGPVTGGGHRKAHNSFAAAKGAVALRGAGQRPLSMWIDGFDDAVTKRHDKLGVRVVRVEYLVGDRLIGECAGDPDRPWRDDTFLRRCELLQLGEHEIRARVTLVDAEVPPGETAATEVVESGVMKVAIREVFAPWMEDAVTMQRDNLLPKREVRAEASSNTGEAKKVVDGRDDTFWTATDSDESPSLSIELARPVSANVIQFTQAGNKLADIDRFDRIKVVHIRINRDKEPLRLEMHADHLGISTLTLPKARKVKRFIIEVAARERSDKPRRVGFTEVVLRR